MTPSFCVSAGHEISSFGGGSVFAGSASGPLDSRGLISQNCQTQPVVIARLRIADLGLGLLQLSLAQFNDGSESQVVARLGEIECEIGLLQQLLGHSQTLIPRVCVQPT